MNLELAIKASISPKGAMSNPSYEICEDRQHSGDWRVEYDHDSNEITIFVGTRAKERATEYAAWKTSQQVPVAQPQRPVSR
jgi:hypothetical protein